MKLLILVLLSVIPVAADAQRPSRRFAVGDTAFCGIVFHVEDNGRTQRVLVCALNDEGRRISWNNGNYAICFAYFDGLYSKNNADRIIATQGYSGQYAANICRFSKSLDSVSRECGDSTRWYLPSRAELKLMYDSLAVTKKVKFAKEGYWSSVERSAADTSRRTEKKAWIVDFLNGRAILNNKANKYNVRAIRAETINL